MSQRQLRNFGLPIAGNSIRVQTRFLLVFTRGEIRQRNLPMKRPFKTITSIVALGLALGLLGSGLGWSADQQAKTKTLPPDGVPKVGDSLKITRELTSFHAEPDFISPVIGTVKLDDWVKVLKVSGDWVEVKSLNGRDEGKTGWAPIRMFGKVQSLDQKALLSGKPVRQAGQIEVALGVKAEKAPTEEVVRESPKQNKDYRRIKEERFLLRDPEFNSPPLIKVSKDTKVQVLKEQGDWVEVEYQGKTGWLHSSSFWGAWLHKK